MRALLVLFTIVLAGPLMAQSVGQCQFAAEIAAYQHHVESGMTCEPEVIGRLTEVIEVVDAATLVYTVTVESNCPGWTVHSVMVEGPYADGSCKILDLEITDEE